MNDSSKTPDIERDEEGRLYDRTVRGHLAGVLGPEQARRLELYPAVRWLVHSMNQAMRQWQELEGLSEGRMQLLTRLRSRNQCPLGELAHDLHVSPRNITGLVDHLERDGLVERVPDAHDRRSVQARLTERGEEMADRIWRRTLEVGLTWFEGMGQEELDQARDLCLRLIRNVEASRGQAAAEQRSDG
ncbi:MAG TPA: MarR family winged helix-turn-helix transcriptional regulator [Candidatus Dormibacteraeota bacterium]|jgi:DNA-binding MarR family transcriptional regulator|nr:MarR family winged helix-turn-helix transcriptional regulator [Candidatus Dormibacteraeota bacterium]